MTTLSSSDSDCKDDWHYRDSATSSSGNNAYIHVDQPGTYRIMLKQLADDLFKITN